MHILCPHCKNPIELVEFNPRQEIACPSCGSSFRLEGGATTTGWESQTKGKKLGRFELLDVVGQGAFGTVYKARDPELDRTVAVKVPRAGNIAGQESLDRFVREARSVAQLRHPSVVTVHEVGQADGLPYLVSDFVEGMMLADLLSARRPGFRESAELAAAVADALQYAHSQGIVHRDVKPSNIMLEGETAKDTKNTKEERAFEEGSTLERGVVDSSSFRDFRVFRGSLLPRLMDFGLAKRDAGEITMTMDGQVLGTPAYMAPEQARGEGHTVDGRGDIYSLGVILYQLLTGELPFRGTTRMLLHQVLHDEPRPPRSLNDKVPRDLETVCLKAMAKEPGRRYQTAGAMADDLRRFLKGEPVLARPVGRAEKLWRWCRRNPAVAGLTAAALALLLATLAATSIGYIYTKQALGVAEQERRNAEQREEETRQAQAKEADARALATAKSKEADENLRTDLLHLAGFERQSFESGRRRRALDALTKAAAIRPGLDLRLEFLRCLDLPDLELAEDFFHTTGVPVGPASRFRVEQQRAITDSDKGRFVAFNWKTNRVFLRQGNDLVEFDYPGGKERARHEGLGGFFNVTVAISPSGRFVLHRPPYKPVQLWDLQTHEQVELPPEVYSPKDEYPCFAFSDRDMLAVANQERRQNQHTIRLFDCVTQKPAGSFDIKAALLDCLCFRPGGRHLAGSVLAANNIPAKMAPGESFQIGYDHQVLLWSVPDGKQVASLRLDGMGNSYSTGAYPNRLDFNREGRLLTAGGKAGSVKVWELAAPGPDGAAPPAPRELRTLLGPQEGKPTASTSGARGVRFAPNGRWLATLGRDDRLKVWDVATGALLTQGTLLPGKETRVAANTGDEPHWSPDGLRLVVRELPERGRWAVTVPQAHSFVPRDFREPVHRLAFDGEEYWLAVALKGVAVFDLRQADPPGTGLGTVGGSFAAGLAFSGGDGRLWAESDDAGAKVWQPPARAVVAETRPLPTRRYRAAAFNAKGERLAAGDEAVLELRVFDLNTGKLVWEQAEEGTRDPEATWIEFSPDGKQLAVKAQGTKGRRVKLWDGQSGRLIHERPQGRATPFPEKDPQTGNALPEYTWGGGHLFFFDNRLATLADPRRLAVADLYDGKELAILRDDAKTKAESGSNFRFSDDGRWCVEEAGSVARLYDVRQGKRLCEVPLGRYRRSTGSVLFNGDGSRFASIEEDHLTIWDTRDAKRLGRVRVAEGFRWYAFRSAPADTTEVLQVERDGTVSSWSPDAQQAKQVCQLQLDGLSQLSYTPGAGQFTAGHTRFAYIYRGTDVRVVRVWDLATGKLVARHELPVRYAPYLWWAVNPAGDRLAVLREGSVSQVWNRDTGQPVLTLQARETESVPRPLRLTRAGDFVAQTGAQERKEFLKVYAVPDGTVRFATDQIARNACCALAEQARYVAVGKGLAITVWEPGSGKKVAEWQGHDAPVTDLAFDNSGRLLVSASAGDETVSLWDPATGERLASFPTGMPQLTVVALSPSGRWLSTGDATGQVKLWDLADVRRRLREAGLDWSAP